VFVYFLANENHSICKQGRSLDLGEGFNCCDLCNWKWSSLQTPCESWSWLL